MTCQEMHETIWDEIVKECMRLSGMRLSGVAERSILYRDEDIVSIYLKAKMLVVCRLYTTEEITTNTRELLLRNCSCVLCALYKECEQCPLFKQQGCKCSSSLSYYSKVINENDVEAAIRIKNIDVLSGDNPDMNVIDVLEERYVQD